MFFAVFFALECLRDVANNVSLLTAALDNPRPVSGLARY